MSHTKRTNEFKTITRMPWENDVRVAARTPHVARMARTSSGTVLVSAHASMSSWVLAVEDNSAAWARLIVEGLIRTGNCSHFITKVPMNTYAVTQVPKCPKPKFLDLKTVAKLETSSEYFTELAIAKMRRQ